MDKGLHSCGVNLIVGDLLIKRLVKIELVPLAILGQVNLRESSLQETNLSVGSGCPGMVAPSLADVYLLFFLNIQHGFHKPHLLLDFVDNNAAAIHIARHNVIVPTLLFLQVCAASF
jgi:hypothetical protein